MRGAEFFILLAWLLLPPLVLASVGMRLITRRHGQVTKLRIIQAWLVLLVASGIIGFALIMFAPVPAANFLGIRDYPVMWAPGAFVAVALAFPLAIWWACRGMRR